MEGGGSGARVSVLTAWLTAHRASDKKRQSFKALVSLSIKWDNYLSHVLERVKGMKTNTGFLHPKSFSDVLKGEIGVDLRCGEKANIRPASFS